MTEMFLKHSTRQCFVYCTLGAVILNQNLKSMNQLCSKINSFSFPNHKFLDPFFFSKLKYS